MSKKYSFGEIHALPLYKANRVVVAETAEQPDVSEIILVSDTDNDFAFVLDDSGKRAKVRSKQAEGIVSSIFPALPFSRIKISHNPRFMSKYKLSCVVMQDNAFVLPAILRDKRTMQYKNINGSKAEKEKAAKEFMDIYGKELWDGSESVFFEQN